MNKKKTCFFIIFMLLLFTLLVPDSGVAKVDPLGIYFNLDKQLRNASKLDLTFLHIKVDLLMEEPESFPQITILYDKDGSTGSFISKFHSVVTDTSDKIVIHIVDTKNIYSSCSTKSELLDNFKVLASKLIESIIVHSIADDDSIVIYLYSKDVLNEGILAYFYQGEYVVNESD